MTSYFVTQAELDGLLKRWSAALPVYVPAAGRQAAARQDCGPGWQRLDDGGALRLAAGPPAASIKTFFFPQPEVMLTYTRRAQDPDKDRMHEAIRDNTMQVVAGLRPCDGRSVVLNNLPFAADPLFQANLARTVLVGFTCEERLATCFCEQVGGSPQDTAGLDIALSQVRDGYVAQVLSPKGEQLLAGAGLTPAAAGDLDALAARRQGAAPSAVAALETLKAQDLGPLYEAPLWQPLGEACINCGVCTFICPTCYCFDMQDEVSRGQGQRIRLWDSCMFPLYSQHTTGHNPRGQKLQRTRNRFLHKLKYFPDRYGPFSCVGCGRCVHDCPVNIDIREVMQDLLTVQHP